MFNSKQIKKAWKIRKEAAVKFGCGVMEISWKECMIMASEEKALEEKLIDMGLRVWEKGNVRRIYVKAVNVKELINFESECSKDSYLEKNTKAIFQRINSDGAYFNLKSNKLESKKPSVQSWFEDSEFSSLFGY